MNSPDPYAALRPAAPEQEQQHGQPAYTDDQAGQAVQQVQGGPQADAGESLAKMDLSKAAPRLPAEDVMDELMRQQREFADQLAGMRKQLDTAQRDAAAVRSLTGPPLVTTYADGVAAKMRSHAAANPDVPPGHFDQVIGQAEELAKSARALAEGTAEAGDKIGGLAGKVERFLTRTHQVTSGKHLDFSAVLSELELVLHEAEQLGAKL